MRSLDTGRMFGISVGGFPHPTEFEELFGLLLRALLPNEKFGVIGHLFDLLRRQLSQRFIETGTHVATSAKVYQLQLPPGHSGRVNFPSTLIFSPSIST